MPVILTEYQIQNKVGREVKSGQGGLTIAPDKKLIDTGKHEKSKNTIVFF